MNCSTTGNRKSTALSLQALPPAYQAMLSIVEKSEQGPATRKAYISSLQSFFAWLVSHNKQITRESVQEYREVLKDQGYSPNSINLKLAAIRRLAREMYLAGKIDIQMRDGLEAVQQTKLVKRKGQSTSLKARWLTLEELQKLLNFEFSKKLSVQKRYEALIAVLSLTGLRMAEVASLKRHNIGERDGRPVLKDVMVKGGELDIKALPQLAYERLKALEEIADPNSRPHKYVQEPKGSEEPKEEPLGSLFKWSEATIRWCLEETARRSQIKFTPHDLRRSFAALAKDAGATIDEISAALGHASIRTTMIYMGDRRKFDGGPGDLLEKTLKGLKS